jgi:hypothetical protein
VQQIRLIAAATLAMLLLPLAGSAAAVTTVVTVKGAHGQTFTVSQAKKLSVKGQSVTVSGRHYDETVGIYIALCVLPAKGGVPTPCGGGIDKTGTSGASQWVSSNPPPYGVGLAIPFSVGGTFKLKLKVGPIIGKFDCRKVKCGIITKADHLNEADRSADVVIPVTFAPAKKK